MTDGAGVADEDRAAGEGIAGEDPIGLGLRFFRQDPGLVARFLPREAHGGGRGFLHGGIAAAALDETMASLSWALDGTPCVTATLEVRFRRPVPLDGRPLRIEAWRDRAERRRRQRVHGRLVLPDGRPAVEASGIFVLAP